MQGTIDGCLPRAVKHMREAGFLISRSWPKTEDSAWLSSPRRTGAKGEAPASCGAPRGRGRRGLLTCASSHSSLGGTRVGFPRYWHSPSSASPEPARRHSCLPMLCRRSRCVVYSKYCGGQEQGEGGGTSAPHQLHPDKTTHGESMEGLREGQCSLGSCGCLPGCPPSRGTGT